MYNNYSYIYIKTWYNNVSCKRRKYNHNCDYIKKYIIAE